MSKLLTVFGATGIQGGSVIRAVLADSALSQSFKIRAVTRDVSKSAAQALAKQGVEVIAADMNSQSSLASALKGTHTLFLVTLPDVVTGAAPGTEFENGKNVADAARDAGVQHIVFSSLINVTDASNGRLPHVAHFDSKAKIEAYIRSQGTPATFVQPGYYMTNFTNLGLLRKGDDGSYTLSGPTGATKAQLPLIFPESDMGKYFVAVVKNRTRVLGKQIYAAADYYTPSRIMAEFEEVTGKKGQYVQVDQAVYKSFLPPSIAQEFLENELLCEEPGFFAGGSLVDGHELLAGVGLAPTTWKEFLEGRRELFV
ncbi:putative family transcriptional regulator protein [Parachaetomium inaequale]|uniref:Family transcriptional regulator protein n=1 Tax=Parachaetomium inaequale TaxID=2588326 RepID=A0AAN6PLD1_9PEZI|nr:putative family transcriptional regulator protein [Parachaetomium inaequale]